MVSQLLSDLGALVASTSGSLGVRSVPAGDRSAAYLEVIGSKTLRDFIHSR
jgi:hypothetical protein